MTTSNEPPLKRTKTDEEDLLRIIRPEIFKNERKHLQDYQSAKPYQHGRLENVFRGGFLDRVLEEIKENSKVNFKESDLFRVYQSIDLGNLSPQQSEADKLPSLMKLKAAIYSREYRAFVERIAGLPPNTLTNKVDCAANCHAPGCHLLCHDDVIGTRRVSYIIYLTEKEWTKEEGGCLELFDSEMLDGSCVPQAVPCKTILPMFNTMAYFVVKPGVSFHAVQEVYGERPRLSIQGWYHAKETPKGIEDATLNRLKSTAKGEDTEGDFTAFETNGTTTNGDKDGKKEFLESDRDYLKQYLNETYLTEKSMQEIQAKFEEDSSVQLRHFLIKEWAEKVHLATSADDKCIGRGQPSLDYSVGADHGWKICGPAHKQRFLQYDCGGSNNGKCSSGSLLSRLKKELFDSLPFARYLEQICSLGLPLAYRGKVRRFRPGLDYTVAHYGVLTTHAVLDATLCFAAGKGNQCRVDEATGELMGTDDDAVWESGDCGGFECYIAADDEEEDEAPAEYNQDDDTELLSVSASNNTLSLVYRDPGTMRFVKYVGCRAPGSRWDIGMEYQVPANNDDESEKEEE